MIISDKHRFVFIHIPKCGGQSLRSLLKNFDDTNGAFTGKVEYHQKYGRMDFVHIPLFALRDSFPEIFEKIKRYNTFCTIREPYERFMSSLSQHLKKYGEKPLHLLNQRETLSISKKIFEVLEKNPNDLPLPAEYIHFQRQCDYIFLDEKKIVDNIFVFRNQQKIIKYINNQLNINISFSSNIQRNQSVKINGGFTRFLIRIGKRGFKKNYLTSFIYDKLVGIENLLINYNSYSRTMDNELRERIYRYYYNDFLLWNRNNRNYE